MRIGIDARYAYDHFPGIGRYIVGLLNALCELEHGHTLVILYNPDLPNTRHSLQHLSQFANVELVRSPVRTFSLQEQTHLPAMLRALKLDVFHSPYYVKPYVGLPCPSVVTIYDLIGRRFPEVLSWRGRLLFRAATALAIRSAAGILTISESACHDIRFSYRVPLSKITVTPLAADKRFRPQPPEAIAAMRERHRLPESYVLYLGANKPHKNLERLIRAWDRVCSEGNDHGAVLVVAGHYEPRYPEARELVAERGLGDRVVFLPNAPEADLPALYSGAICFAFPSYYEGFGLPPLEAMACGTPVLCAYASSLPEVVGNAAVTVDPFSFIEMAEGLTKLLQNSRLRDHLRAAGQERARSFSWRRTALGSLRAYEQAVTGSR